MRILRRSVDGGSSLVNVPALDDVAGLQGEAADAAEAALTQSQRQAKADALIADTKQIKDDLKAGTLTFGNAARDKAVMASCRAILFLLRGELDE